jgi:hypothetical protein
MNLPLHAREEPRPWSLTPLVAITSRSTSPLAPAGVAVRRKLIGILVPPILATEPVDRVPHKDGDRSATAPIAMAARVPHDLFWNIF